MNCDGYDKAMARPGRIVGGIRLLGESLRIHAVLIGLILLYTGAAIVTERMYRLPGSVRLSLYSKDLLQWTAILFGIVVVYRCIYTAACIRPTRPMQYVLRDLRKNFLRFDRLTMALPFYLCFPVFTSAFTSFKAMIPAVKPFCWDETLARWDAIVHGGIEPWRLLQGVLGHPPVTRVVNVLYNSWFILLFIMLFWQTFSLRNRRSRMRFLYTFVLCWAIVGTLAATLLSSAGPCYYGRVTDGPDIYAPLMQYLRSVGAMAVTAQDGLWDMYLKRHTVQFAGISAMPSMHVSMAFLFVLIGYKNDRRLGRLLLAYLIMIIIGSVHLAWHYAIDAYVAIALTWMIWWTIGRLQSISVRNSSSNSGQQENA